MSEELVNLCFPFIRDSIFERNVTVLKNLTKRIKVDNKILSTYRVNEIESLQEEKDVCYEFTSKDFRISIGQRDKYIDCRRYLYGIVFGEVVVKNTRFFTSCKKSKCIRPSHIKRKPNSFLLRNKNRNLNPNKNLKKECYIKEEEEEKKEFFSEDIESLISSVPGSPIDLSDGEPNI